MKTGNEFRSAAGWGLLVVAVLAFAVPAAVWAAPPSQQLSLRVGQKARVQGLDLTFVSVPQDSRCPQYRPCPWPGRAVVRLDAQRGPTRQSLSLTTPGQTSADVAGFRIALQRLDPYPGAGGRMRPAYVATLQVSKLTGSGAGLGIGRRHLGAPVIRR